MNTMHRVWAHLMAARLDDWAACGLTAAIVYVMVML